MKLQTPYLLYLIQISSLLLTFVLAESTQPPFSCDTSDPVTKSYPFCETTLSISQRVQDLVSRLTLDEKISQLVNSAPAIPRLGIPDYEWWSEALHGVAYLSGVSQGIRFNGTIKSATSFPQVILTAASFDAHLWYRIGQAVGIEARAIYNAGQATGMTFWAPNINIYRDPRWGRGQETPGEDPLVTGKYAVSYVRGIQGDSFEGGKLGEEEHLQASACCKHFTAYDLDNWKGINRFVFNAKVTLQDLADTYQPPFQSCIQQGKASGIMCAYNRVNGVPNCADYNLLSKTARGQWGFNGYITSDCDAVSIIHEKQGYTKLPEDAVAAVLKAGMDVNCGTYLKNYTKSAVKMRKLPISEIDRALHNLFSVRMRLGLFNGIPVKQPFGNIGSDQVCSQEHQNLALEAARNGIVLLKNNDKLLPLSKSKITSLAVIGPNADSAKTLVGNYAGPPCKSVTPLQGLQSYVKNTMYHPGCSAVNCSSALTTHAVNIAKGADHVVLVMGLDQTQESEENDRVDLVLPPKQQNLISSVARAAKNPVILVLLSGGPVDISFAKYDRHIGSILWAGYPGEAGGLALAEIIFGDHNPGGRLPLTWYPQSYTKIPMTDMRMRPEPSSGYPGRTYRFYQGPKVFEFGYGLSYSNYSYEFLPVTQKKVYLNNQLSSQMVENSNPPLGYMPVSDMGTELCDKIRYPVTVRVQNHGEMTGKHPLLLFVRQAKFGNGRPLKQLVAFQSVNLNAGERDDIEFELSPCEHLSTANEDGLMVIEGKKLWLSKPQIASVGACCLVGIICSGLLYIANAGDSRVVLGRLEKAFKDVKAVQLSSEHNASLESVREELRSLHPDDPQIVVLKHKVWRVKGIIQISRSIGDAYLKKAEFNKEPLLPKFRVPESFEKPILQAEPSILVQKLHPEDLFLIFASDGLWEHLSNQEAVNIVNTCPRNGIARRLVKAALHEAAKKREMRYSDLKKIDRGVRRHFHDDITVIVLFLDSHLISRSSWRGPSVSIRGGGGGSGVSGNGNC